MPAGYATTTLMESTLTGNFELSAELSDLRIIERPVGQSRPPSNIIRLGNAFDFYLDIHFVGHQGRPWPEVEVDVEYYLEGLGAVAPDLNNPAAASVYTGPVINAGNSTFPLLVNADPDAIINQLVPGIYKVSAAVFVRWRGQTDIIMNGYIEGATLQITN